MELCQEKRGVFADMTYVDTKRVRIHYEMPLNEIIYDFFDTLKSRTRGYASLDYEIKGYVPSKLVKLDLLLNGEMCDALSIIVHEDRAYARGRKIAEKLKEAISPYFLSTIFLFARKSSIIIRCHLPLKLIRANHRMGKCWTNILE